MTVANNIGSVVSSVSLDSVTASMSIVPVSSVVNKANVNLPVAVANATWINSGSNLVATVTLDNDPALFSDGDRVAIYWAAGAMVYGLVSSSGATSFVATFSATQNGAVVLPATNTAIKISKATIVVDVTFVGNNMVQFIYTSTQPGSLLLFDAGNTMRLYKTLASANDYYGWPLAAGDLASATVPGNFTITYAHLYNNSITAAVAKVAAGV